MSKRIDVYDSTNNEYKPLSGDSSGKLNIGNFPSTQTVDGFIEVIQLGEFEQNAVERNLKLQRYRGNAYAVQVMKSNITAATVDDGVVLYNDTSGASEKTICVYNVQYTLSTVSTSGKIDVQLRTVSTISVSGAPTTTSDTNLKIGESSSPVTIYSDLDTSTFSSTSNIDRRRYATSTEPTHAEVLDFQEEFIQIPTGHGLQVHIPSSGTNDTVDLGISLRYIVVDAGDPI